METMELLQYLRFREVQKILDELLTQRLIDPSYMTWSFGSTKGYAPNMLYENVKFGELILDMVQEVW